MKKSSNPNNVSTRSRSLYLTREQAEFILKVLEGEELPEHDSPFKLYFNGKLIGSANPNYQTENTNNTQDENK